MRTAALLALALGVGALTVRADPPAVVTPSYGAALPIGLPYALSAADSKAQRDHQERLISLLESMDRRLANLEAAAGVKQAATRQDQQAALLVAKCASCHTPAAAEKKGGGFELFDADGRTPRRLDARSQNRVKQSVVDGTMPPEGRAPLSPSEKALFQ